MDAIPLPVNHIKNITIVVKLSDVDIMVKTIVTIISPKLNKSANFLPFLSAIIGTKVLDKVHPAKYILPRAPT